MITKCNRNPSRPKLARRGFFVFENINVLAVPLESTLMQTYGGEIRAMLREAETTRGPGNTEVDDEPF